MYPIDHLSRELCEETGISLNEFDAPSQPAAVRLTLWPGPKYPGWNRAVLVEVSAQKTILIQSFSDADLSSVVRLVAD